MDVEEIVYTICNVKWIQETKLDDSFPEGQFHIQGYLPPFRRDRNRYGGGLIIYVGEDTPCDTLIKHSTPNNIEAIFN